MRNAARFGLLSASAFALAMVAGCAVGPDYARPADTPAATAPFLRANASVVSSEGAESKWWLLYDDEALNQLVADALTANTDIRVAVANLEKSESRLRVSRSQRLPSTQINASTTFQRLPDWQTLPGEQREFGSVDTGISVGYEVDLFGRIKRDIEATTGDAQAAEADAASVQIAVVSNTVRAYLASAADAEQIAVAKQTVALLDKSVSVTTARFEAGLGDRLDVIRITALRDDRRADIAPLEADRDAALLRLATLTGRAPRDLPPIAARMTLLKIGNPIPVGDGKTLIERRPDIRAAERRLAAATARIGLATADFYPRISLGGSVGSTSYGFGDVFGSGPFRWAAGPLISWTFPNVEVALAHVAGAKADTKAALATFDGTILSALQETETALSAYAQAIDRRTDLALGRDAAEHAANIALTRQREGQIDFLTLLDAQRTLAEAQARLAASEAQIASTQVDLFRALGGGWQAQSDATTKVAAR
jgi:multidrug efflux system outer membrane protein